MRRAVVYWRKQQFLIHAESRTTDGVWILSQPCSAIPETTDDHELSRTILAALAGSKTNVPHPAPDAWKGVVAPLLAAAGVKTWGTFSKGARCIDAVDDGSQIVLTPAKNLGPRDGFEADSSRRVVVDGDVGVVARSMLCNPTL